MPYRRRRHVSASPAGRYSSRSTAASPVLFSGAAPVRHGISPVVSGGGVGVVGIGAGVAGVYPSGNAPVSSTFSSSSSSSSSLSSSRFQGNGRPTYRRPSLDTATGNLAMGSRQAVFYQSGSVSSGSVSSGHGYAGGKYQQQRSVVYASGSRTPVVPAGSYNPGSHANHLGHRGASMPVGGSGSTTVTAASAFASFSSSSSSFYSSSFTSGAGAGAGVAASSSSSRVLRRTHSAAAAVAGQGRPLWIESATTVAGAVAPPRAVSESPPRPVSHLNLHVDDVSISTPASTPASPPTATSISTSPSESQQQKKGHSLAKLADDEAGAQGMGITTLRAPRLSRASCASDGSSSGGGRPVIMPRGGGGNTGGIAKTNDASPSGGERRVSSLGGRVSTSDGRYKNDGGGDDDDINDRAVSDRSSSSSPVSTGVYTLRRSPTRTAPAAISPGVSRHSIGNGVGYGAGSPSMPASYPGDTSPQVQAISHTVSLNSSGSGGGSTSSAASSESTSPDTATPVTFASASASASSSSSSIMPKSATAGTPPPIGTGKTTGSAALGHTAANAAAPPASNDMGTSRIVRGADTPTDQEDRGRGAQDSKQAVSSASPCMESTSSVSSSGSSPSRTPAVDPVSTASLGHVVNLEAPFARFGRAVMYGEDYAKLVAGGWLTSRAITFQGQIIMAERGLGATTADSDGRPRAHFFSPHMYTMLSRTDADGTWPVPGDELLPWTAKVGDILGFEHLFFPVNEDDDHWALIAVTPRDGNIDYYDSLNGHEDAVRPTLMVRQYLEQYEKLTSAAPRQWTRRVMARCSKQDNPSDCGLFVCKYMECLLDGDDIAFDPILGQQYRSKIIASAWENRIEAQQP